MPKVLYVVHNHPAVMPGGAETYALELYEAMRNSGRYDPLLLARTGPPVSRSGRVHEGTLLEPVGGDPNQYFFHTDIADYDWFLSTSRNKDVYTKFFREFLTAYEPDVVHFQHTLFLGYDILRETRRTLPNAAIVYTLHEYVPICHNNGQMFTTGGERCSGASPRRCHDCFPEIPPQQFFLRERFIKSHLGVVDRFVSPSHFLAGRYTEWGIDPARITVEENGRRPLAAVSDTIDSEGAERADRNRIGYFGQFTAFKGADVLMKAMKLLAVRPTLRLHGANIEHQPEGFQVLFRSLLEAAGDDVTLVGRYRPEELSALMRAVDWVVVPSIWWENAPLVIQEAFAHGRPVICSDIGGMAEKVTDGVDGLHFRAGDPQSLADTIERTIGTPGLWDRLRAGIGEVHPLARHVANLTDLYDELRAGRSGKALARSGHAG
ncbi:MAG TPA: glycosyltransferase family 4 protein [Acidimicrobiia bacterium]|nr:glycosyltransferase family 4 protein [Acidimicrobiia bacterium]